MAMIPKMATPLIQATVVQEVRALRVQAAPRCPGAGAVAWFSITTATSICIPRIIHQAVNIMKSVSPLVRTMTMRRRDLILSALFRAATPYMWMTGAGQTKKYCVTLYQVIDASIKAKNLWTDYRTTQWHEDVKNRSELPQVSAHEFFNYLN